MEKRKTFAYIYFLSRVFFVGYGYSLLVNLANQDAWISFILGEILAISFIWIITKIKKNTNNENFFKHCGNPLKIVYFLLAFFMAIEILVIFQTFASNFFLIKSPLFFIIFPALLLVYRICKNGWDTIGQVGNVLMYISLTVTILAIITLLSYVTKEHFLPIGITPIPKILQSALYYASYSTAPLLLLITIPKTNNKIYKNYLIAHLTILAMGLLVIGILGPNLLQIFRYPEYMILKKIKIFNFIEKVENIVSIAILFDMFMTIVISLNTTKEILPEKRKNLYFIIILFIIFFTTLFLGKNYNLALQLYYLQPLIFFIFFVVITTLFFLQIKKKKLKRSILTSNKS